MVVADVEPLEGEALAEHQEFVVTGVREHLEEAGRSEDLDKFLAGSKAFGRSQTEAADFVALLVELFGETKGVGLVPQLAKLIRNDERRLALLEYVDRRRVEAVRGEPTVAASILPPQHADHDDEDGLLVSIQDSSSRTVAADFAGGEPWQLAVCEGEDVDVVERHADGWTEVVNGEGGRGAVPTSFLEARSTTKICEASKRVRERLGDRFQATARSTRAFASRSLEARALRAELGKTLGEDDARWVAEQVAPLVDDDLRRGLDEAARGRDDDWIDRLRTANVDEAPPEAAPPRNPFDDASNPFTEPPAPPSSAPAHYDEREILLSRSHGVGAYNPETVERLQRLREDEELAARLQREEDEAAAGRSLDAALDHQPDSPPRPSVPRPDASLWDALFGAESPSPPRGPLDVEQPHQPPPSDPASSGAAAISGADVWSSIFGGAASSRPPPSPDDRARSRQELDDEQLARQLQEEEDRAATARRQQLQVADNPAAPPTSEVGLFRCGACSETMHVRNALPGAQFSCPLCGRVNTI